jgi:hypothetical protein
MRNIYEIYLYRVAGWRGAWNIDGKDLYYQITNQTNSRLKKSSDDAIYFILLEWYLLQKAGFEAIRENTSRYGLLVWTAKQGGVFANAARWLLGKVLHIKASQEKSRSKQLAYINGSIKYFSLVSDSCEMKQRILLPGVRSELRDEFIIHDDSVPDFDPLVLSFQRPTRYLTASLMSVSADKLYTNPDESSTLLRISNEMIASRLKNPEGFGPQSTLNIKINKCINDALLDFIAGENGDSIINDMNYLIESLPSYEISNDKYIEYFSALNATIAFMVKKGSKYYSQSTYDYAKNQMHEGVEKILESNPNHLEKLFVDPSYHLAYDSVFEKEFFFNKLRNNSLKKGFIAESISGHDGHDHRFSHSDQQVSDRGMGDQQRLHRKIDDLQRQWELLNKKLSMLNEQQILETRLEEKFRLTKLIDDTKAQYDQIEEQLKDMESKLVKVDSDAKEVAGRNDDHGPLRR